MTLVLTPTSFLELLQLTLTWEWESAVDRFLAAQDQKHLPWPVKTGYTTVDKVMRILYGLGIVSEKQRRLLWKDQRTQALVLHNCHRINVGDSVDLARRETQKCFVLPYDPTKSVDRSVLLRNTRLYISERGVVNAAKFSAKYAAHITKAMYLAEIQRQQEQLKEDPAVRGAVMKNYRRKVTEGADPV